MSRKALSFGGVHCGFVDLGKERTWKAFLIVTLILSASALFVFIDSQFLVLKDGYRVEVNAPANLNWTLWVPRPSVQMSAESIGIIYSISVVDTQFGQMDNISGKGDVTYERTIEQPITASGIPVNYVLGDVTYSGQDVPRNFHVYRESADPSVIVSVEGFIWHYAWSRYGDADCGGGGYEGAVEEGWSEPPRLFVDCGFPMNPGPCLSIFLFILALGFGVTAMAAKRAKVSKSDVLHRQKDQEDAELASSSGKDRGIQ